MAQDIPRCLIMAPTMLQDAPRPLQDVSQWPKSSPRRPRKGPTPEDSPSVWLSRLFASDGHPRPQDGSTMAQEGSTRGSREPQDGPKNA
eukprot:4630114-Pyramimonas_sp.AAC.1